MIRCCIAAVLAAAAVPASAADFTFDVPVSVRNVPVISQVRVNCLVSVLAAGVDGSAAESNIVGRGEVTVEAPGGTYEGTVVVPVENRGTRMSSAARSYSCDLEGLGRDAAGGLINLGSNWGYSLERRIGTGLISEQTQTRANLP
jgi:hypothetical protein